MIFTPMLAGVLIAQGLPSETQKVEFGKPFALKLVSRPVEFNGGMLSILSASQCTLHFGSFRMDPKPPPVRVDYPMVWGVRWNYMPPKVEPDPFPYNLTFEPRLKAVLKAAIAQYSKFDYRVYGAVYDVKGKLLGTASAIEPVEYVRLSDMLTLYKDIELDFGVSNDFKDAAYIAFAVSNPDVPKPPDANENRSK